VAGAASAGMAITGGSRRRAAPPPRSSPPISAVGGTGRDRSRRGRRQHRRTKSHTRRSTRCALYAVDHMVGLAFGGVCAPITNNFRCVVRSQGARGRVLPGKCPVPGFPALAPSWARILAHFRSSRPIGRSPNSGVLNAHSRPRLLAGWRLGIARWRATLSATRSQLPGYQRLSGRCRLGVVAHQHRCDYGEDGRTYTAC
jgi:hypothetical protein